MVYIEKICALEILDSRGMPTLKATTLLSDGIVGTANIPSGASTGVLEAVELRDNDSSRYFGKGVNKAIANVDKISNELKGMSAFDQSAIDAKLKELDGSDNYSNLGANAVLSASLSVARASAHSLGIPLYRYIGGIDATTIPTPMLNIINGGGHADNNVDFQEYMLVPSGFSTFKEGIRASSEVYQHLKKVFKDSGFATSLGDEGGFAPNLQSNEEPIVKILEAIKAAGYVAGKEFNIALDPASSAFYKDGKYILKSEKKELNSSEMVSYYENLCSKYPIIMLEDGLAEDDWDGWVELTKRMKDKVQLVGDDIFVTNEKILQKAIDMNVANSVLIKLNQIGTLTQTMDTVRLAKKHNYKLVVSHRSGETEDTFIADLAVGLNTKQMKTGASARGERIAKYNRLLEIENELSKSYFNK